MAVRIVNTATVGGHPPMSHDPAAGQRLREFMEPRIGRVQPWAERHGIGRDTIYALWRGREPVPDTITRLASALGVTYRELMDVREGVSERQETNDDLLTLLRDQTIELRAQNAALRDLASVMSDQTARQAGWNEGLATLAARLVQVTEGRSGKR